MLDPHSPIELTITLQTLKLKEEIIMLNNCVIMGRITKDLEMRQVGDGNAAVNFTVAVDRDYKTKSGETMTDFIPCQAYGKTAEFIGKYFGKGRMINVIGSFRSNPYKDKDGNNRIIYCLQAEKVNFTGEPKKDASIQPQNNYVSDAPIEAPDDFPSFDSFNGDFDDGDVF